MSSYKSFVDEYKNNACAPVLLSNYLQVESDPASHFANTLLSLANATCIAENPASASPTWCYTRVLALIKKLDLLAVTSDFISDGVLYAHKMIPDLIIRALVSKDEAVCHPCVRLTLTRLLNLGNMILPATTDDSLRLSVLTASIGANLFFEEVCKDTTLSTPTSKPH